MGRGHPPDGGHAADAAQQDAREAAEAVCLEERLERLAARLRQQRRGGRETRCRHPAARTARADFAGTVHY